LWLLAAKFYKSDRLLVTVTKTLLANPASLFRRRQGFLMEFWQKGRLFGGLGLILPRSHPDNDRRVEVKEKPWDEKIYWQEEAVPGEDSHIELKNSEAQSGKCSLNYWQGFFSNAHKTGLSGLMNRFL